MVVFRVKLNISVYHYGGVKVTTFPSPCSSMSSVNDRWAILMWNIVYAYRDEKLDWLLDMSANLMNHSHVRYSETGPSVPDAILYKRHMEAYMWASRVLFKLPAIGTGRLMNRATDNIGWDNAVDTDTADEIIDDMNTAVAEDKERMKNEELNEYLIMHGIV
jgi:hypothetical protein